jgi:ATP-dependent RNA helicase RhlE
LTQFNDFGLAKPIMQALANEGHATPTPIQIGAIPSVMEGRDLLGVAQTGTGKTAAFALPILHRLSESKRDPRRGDCRVLVLAPTRELAAQVLERFRAYGKFMRLRSGLVIGGASMGKQKAMVRDGVDVLVATPGRLADLMKQNAIRLDQVETLVLDEVDQMLDLGFIHAIRAIAAALPAKRQNIFLSATMPPPIAKLANGLLRDPVRVEIAANKPLKIDQSVLFIERGAKPKALLDMVRTEKFTRGLVFTKTKHGADKVVKALNAAGSEAYAIHGNRSQVQRERALDAFRSGRARILVATDIAARGIDVTGVSHVINYDLPNVPETYVHRIGRTARAGAAGVAVSFCSGEERPLLRSIEKLTQQRIAVVASENGELRACAVPDTDKPFREEGVLSELRSGQPQKQRKPHRKGQNGGQNGGQNRGDNRSENRGQNNGGQHHRGAGSAKRPDGNPARRDGRRPDAVNRNNNQPRAERAQSGDLPAFITMTPANEPVALREEKGQENGERGTSRIRRRRHRGSAGRELSRHAG